MTRLSVATFLAILFFVNVEAADVPSGATPTLTRSVRWLYYDNAPVWLVGYDLQQLFNDSDYSVAQVKGYLDIIAAGGVTAFRVWLNTWFMQTDDYFPYVYTGNKFDLTQWNSTFWSRWVELLEYAKTKGLIVEVVIFSEYPNTTEMDLWTTRNVYWRSANNSNGYYDDVSGDLWPQFFTLNYQPSGKPNLTTLQKALAAKAVDEFNGIGNVFFQIHNEFPAITLGGNGAYINQVYPWQQEMADYVGKTKGAITSVHAHEMGGMHTTGVDYFKTRDSISVLNFHPYSTHNDNGNINSIGNLYASLQNTGKVLMIDESHQFDRGDNLYLDTVTREMWASFTNGIYYFAYQDDPFVTGDSAWITRNNRIKMLSYIASRINWADCSRSPSTVTSGPGIYWEGIVDSGKTYVFYFTGTKSTTAASLTLPAGTYTYTWYDPRSYDTDGIASNTVAGATPASITAPSTNAWNAASGLVLVIVNQSLPPTPPSGIRISAHRPDEAMRVQYPKSPAPDRS